MNDLDTLELPPAPIESAVSTTTLRRCSRHSWEFHFDEASTMCPNCVTPWKCNGPHLSDQTAAAQGRSGYDRCTLCGKAKDVPRSKMGRKVGQRAKREERGLAKSYGGTREGFKGGPIDVATGLFAFQSKVSPSWFRETYWNELVKLPRTGGRIPVLVVSDGGAGRHCRRMVVLDERDWRDLHGGKVPDAE